MKIALLLTFICMAAALPQARQIDGTSNPNRIPGEYLVVLHAPIGKNSNFIYSTKVASRIAAISPQISILKMFTNLKAPILYVKTTDEAVMSQLFQLDEVQIISANAVEQMIEQCQSQNTGSQLWGLSRTSARVTPDYSSATYNSNANDGSNVRVYIHDTGIRYSHVDFEGRAQFGENFTPSPEPDVNGHGTHCAGTVGGATYGISKSVTLVNVKVLGDSGSGSWDGIVQGLDWMVGDIAAGGWRGVASMSLGGGINTAADSAVNSANAAGTPVVVAAGNSNGNACNYSPARATGAITVGSTDINENLSSFSNWGTCVDVLAPGSSILSASHLSDTGTRTLSGTSMACPHVAGVVATYLNDNPTASPDQVRAYLASSSTKDAINLRGTSGTPNNLLYNNCA